MDICHFGLVGSGVPNPTNFWSTKLASAKTRAPLLPLILELNRYCKSVAPPWFIWCSIQVVRPHGSEAEGLPAHLKDGSPLVLIARVGPFTDAAFWVGCVLLLSTGLWMLVENACRLLDDRCLFLKTFCCPFLGCY